MLRLLFFDDQLSDDSSSASYAAKELEATEGYSVIPTDFSDMEQKINDNLPDLIILDLQEVTASGDQTFPGTGICEWIWKNRFCPIVVYSAFPDELSDTYSSHPFVEVVKKGKESVQTLKESVSALRPQIESIREAERSIRGEFSLAMREVAPYAYLTFKDNPAQRDDAILRCGRRRVAALMDNLSAHGDCLACWEQYLSPPLSPDVKLGDILREKRGQSDDPTSFRVVLTPSCDLVASGDRTPKVDKVLVACCCSMKEGLDLTDLPSNTARAKLKDRLPGTVLSHGYFQAVIPFPCLENRIPTMAANLRDLQFIPLADIGVEGTPFLRIASIDSPFRELVAWAYLQIACRPGLPDRDLHSWRDEIVASVEEEGDSERT